MINIIKRFNNMKKINLSQVISLEFVPEEVNMEFHYIPAVNLWVSSHPKTMTLLNDEMKNIISEPKYRVESVIDDDNNERLVVHGRPHIIFTFAGGITEKKYFKGDKEARMFYNGFDMVNDIEMTKVSDEE